MPPTPIERIVASYKAPVVRAYSKVCFSILRQPFLEEIDQWLPEQGRILDVGCGCGLFSLYFAQTQPRRELLGIDIDTRRVTLALASARDLGLDNVDHPVANATEWTSTETFAAVYMLDVLHHLRAEAAEPLPQVLAGRLKPGGTLLLKEVADRPRYKMLFTPLLDRLMVGMDPIHCWSPPVLARPLERLGFDVKRHQMNDYLPYPHVLYICHKRADAIDRSEFSP